MSSTLRQLHLMAPTTISPTPFPLTGECDKIVEKPRYEDGRVRINATQYFDAAPELSWRVCIGGYQPAPECLKNHKGRPLSFDDMKHHQRLLKILSETDRIMQTLETDIA